jgi:hypothetical protein
MPFDLFPSAPLGYPYGFQLDARAELAQALLKAWGWPMTPGGAPLLSPEDLVRRAFEVATEFYTLAEVVGAIRARAVEPPPPATPAA